MIEFINYIKSDPNSSWKKPLKIGLLFILFGYIIFIFKELIVGIISLLLIGIGIYFLYIAYYKY